MVRLGLGDFLGWGGVFWVVWVGVQLGLHFLLLGGEVQFGSAVVRLGLGAFLCWSGVQLGYLLYWVGVGVQLGLLFGSAAVRLGLGAFMGWSGVHLGYLLHFSHLLGLHVSVAVQLGFVVLCMGLWMLIFV